MEVIRKHACRNRTLRNNKPIGNKGKSRIFKRFAAIDICEYFDILFDNSKTRNNTVKMMRYDVQVSLCLTVIKTKNEFT